MKLTLATALAAATLGTAAFADGHITGDAAAGEQGFNKCKSCHMVQSADGEDIVRGGRTGPNLWGIVGRQAGTVEGFRYGDDLVKAGEEGLVWTEETFVAYVADPRGYLREFLNDPSARAKMSYKQDEGVEDIYAFLASVSPEPEAMEGEAASN